LPFTLLDGPPFEREVTAGWFFFFSSAPVGLIAGVRQRLVSSDQPVRFYLEFAGAAALFSGMAGGLICLLIYQGDAEQAFGRLGKDWGRVVLFIVIMATSTMLGVWWGLSRKSWLVTWIHRVDQALSRHS
jgi:hypothetical protein